MKRKLTQVLMLLICLGFVMSAKATQFLFTYEGVINSVTSPSLDRLVSVGDTLQVNVYMDNGGTTVNSQTWVMGDTIFADISVGSYNANYTEDFAGVWAGVDAFTTDNVGQLTSVNWQGTHDSLVNYDSLGVGGGVRLFVNAIQPYSNDGYAYFSPLFHLSDTWTDPVATSVPEPTTLGLLFLGIVGIGYRRRQSL